MATTPPIMATVLSAAELAAAAVCSGGVYNKIIAIV